MIETTSLSILILIIILLIIILILTISLIIIAVGPKKMKQSFNKRALDIFLEGEYINQGFTYPTKVYPYGLNTKGTSQIKKDKYNNLLIQENYHAYCPKSKKLEYSRVVNYEFSKGPLGAFYISRKSYHDDHIMSIRNGFGILSSPESLTFKLRGDIYTSSSYSKNMKFLLQKTKYGYKITWYKANKVHAKFNLLQQGYLS